MGLERVSVGDLSIEYTIDGHGDLLVLVHGGLSDHRVWGRQIRMSATGYTVVAWDAPGTGGSSDPPDDFSIADYADCLGRLIDTLGLGPAHVVGHSFGGGLAIALCDRRPEIVRSLILAGAYAGWKGSLPPGEIEARLEGVLASLDDKPALIEMLISTLFETTSDPEVGEMSRAILSDFRPGPARTMALAFAEADLTPTLGRISVPTLVIHGEKDVRARREVPSPSIGPFPARR